MKFYISRESGKKIENIEGFKVVKVEDSYSAYTIEINSLDELLKLHNMIGEAIILRGKNDEFYEFASKEHELKIYDDYIE